MKKETKYVVWGVISAAIILITLAMVVKKSALLGATNISVEIGPCTRGVYDSNIFCEDSTVYGYFLFPREITGKIQRYDQATRTLYVITGETVPNGCYRKFDIKWNGIDVDRVVLKIEINGMQAGRTEIDIATCSFID